MEQPIATLTDPSRVQSGLLPRILDLIRADAPAPGARLSELRLAELLQVSRTPVRAALCYLARHGVVHRAARGFTIAAPEAADRMRNALAAGTPDEATRLTERLVADRQADTLPAEVSESDLMRRYQTGRGPVQRALTQLAGLGAVERKVGHGWTFLPTRDSPAARRESLRWRMLVEPGALLEPGYRLDPAWVASIGERHARMLATPWDGSASIAFYEMNAAYHEGLAAGSGNRHLLLAVQQQNSLRRLSNYRWGFASDPDAARRRVRESCQEHLTILSHAAAGDSEVAAALMRRHIARVMVL